jgi:hypothetical protein
VDVSAPVWIAKRPQGASPAVHAGLPRADCGEGAACCRIGCAAPGERSAHRVEAAVFMAKQEMGCPAFSGQLIGAISCCELPVQVLVVDFLRSLIAEC